VPAISRVLRFGHHFWHHVCRHAGVGRVVSLML
jgi:hypothetical protein